jgi:hypothetical protein
MFSKTYAETDAIRRGDKYSEKDFYLSIFERAVEFLYLAFVYYKLAALVAGPIMASLEGTPGVILSVLILLMGFFLAKGIVSMIRSQLEAAFRLDPRPFWGRLREKLAFILFVIPYLTLATTVVFLLLSELHVLGWSLVFLGVVWAGLLYINALTGPSLPDAKFLREPRDDEIPRDLHKLAFLFVRRKSVGMKDIVISSAFHKGLVPPYVVNQKLVITEKALFSFPPADLKARIVWAILKRIVKAQKNLLILRIVIFALSAPISLILLNSFGLYRGYPIFMDSPALIGLIWMGVLWTYWFEELATLFTTKFLDLKIAATTCALTADFDGLSHSVVVMAAYNMDPFTEHPIIDVFRPRSSPDVQLKSIKDGIVAMADMTAEKEREKKKKKLSKDQGDVAAGGEGKGEAGGEAKPDAGASSGASSGPSSGPSSKNGGKDPAEGGAVELGKEPRRRGAGPAKDEDDPEDPEDPEDPGSAKDPTTRTN